MKPSQSSVANDGGAPTRRVITGDTVSRWVARELGINPADGVGIGVSDSDGIVAGALFNNYHRHMIEVSIASRQPDWCTPGILRAMFWYPFGQLRVRRLQATVARRNRKGRRFVERLGFRYEGMARDAYPTGGDAVVYSMLPRECRWVRNR